MSYGAQSMIGPLRTVVVRAPGESFGAADPDDWNYAAPIDLERAREEHAAFVGLITDFGAEVWVHDAPLPGLADALFVHDPVLVTSRGSIGLAMGKPGRVGEETALVDFLEVRGVPVLGVLEPPARAEGGDLVWLDERTLAVGLGYRTNVEGLGQLQDLLDPLGVDVLGFDLPVWDGAEACLHLQSMISLVDERKAVVYGPLLPVRLRQLLDARRYELIEVPGKELATLGPNVLALEPGRCVVVEGNPVTAERLERAGCRVRAYRGDEISLKAEGGATCLTRPVLRD